MTTTSPSTALVPAAPAFSNIERLALAGFLAGYSGPDPPLRVPRIDFPAWFQRLQIRRSERPGLPRRSPAEPRRSRLFCTHTLLAWASTGVDCGRPLSHGLTAARIGHR
jgi:hypothetical protein